MPRITSFCTKRKLFRSISSESFCAVDMLKKPRAGNSQVLIKSSCCELPCCDLTSAAPTRVPFHNNASARKVQKKTRYFQQDWLQKHSWLVYCKSDNRAYCHICQLVISSGSKTENHVNGANTFTSKGYNHWRNGTRDISLHANSAFHKESVWLLRQRKESKPIDEELTSVGEEVKAAMLY